MSEIENKKAEEIKPAQELSDDLVDQIVGGTDPGEDPEKEGDGVTTWNGAILLPEIP